MEQIYRTDDDLRNFQIRAELSKVSGSSGGRTVHNSNGEEEGSESYIFTWQKKAFSQREFEFYGDPYHCTNALENRYNRDITKLTDEGGRKNGRLFCYIEGDQSNIPPDLLEIPQVMESGHQSRPTFVTQFGSAVRRRHTPHKQSRQFSVGMGDPVLDRPSMEQRLTQRINTPFLRSMYIMADLHHVIDGIEIWEEHLLCRIQVDDRGMVSVKPDFTTEHTPYRIEAKNKDVYEYNIEPLTDVVSGDYTAQEKNLQDEVHQIKIEELHNLVGTQFFDPPEGDALSVHLLGEIVSAEGFEYDDLYVTAHLHLPEFWERVGDQDLSITTQISRTKSKHLYNVAYFNCPFDYELLYHNITTIEGDLGEWPSVLIEVYSLDYWDRHRVEGYGHLSLPTTPGVYEMGVATWRPRGSAVVDRLKRFFVGGASKLSEVSYISKPSEFEGGYLSKYGFQTESSGSVLFKFNIIHHSRSSAQRYQSKQLNSAITRHGGLRTSLAATLDVFQRARQKAAMSLLTTSTAIN